jgi:hemolysin activation/secretion protein
MDAPWNEDHYLAGYAVWSDSNTAFGEGFSTTGKGFILGLRYLVPLESMDRYFHNLSFGLDYKDFDETLGFAGEEDSRSEAPISYLPFLVEYSGTYYDSSGSTRLKAGVNWAFRGLVGQQDEFANKRLHARGDYLYLDVELGREQQLPWGMELDLEINGQVATEPLVSSEQFAAGGLDSVRGYRESDSLGDDGVRASVEWQLPEFGQLVGYDRNIRLTPYLFYDFAWLDVQKAQAGQTDEFRLNGAGIGFRGDVMELLDYQVDWAHVLSATDRTDRGDNRLHFLVKYHF